MPDVPVDVDGDSRETLRQCTHTGGIPKYRCKRERMAGKSVCRHHQNLRDKRNRHLKSERFRRKVLRLANQAHHDLELRLGMGETPPTYTQQLLQLCGQGDAAPDCPSHVIGDIEWSTGRSGAVSGATGVCSSVFPAASDSSHVSALVEHGTGGGPSGGDGVAVWESWTVQQDDGITVLQDEVQQEVEVGTGAGAGATFRETVGALAVELLASSRMNHGSVDRVTASVRVHLYQNHYGVSLKDLDAVPPKLRVRSAWFDPEKRAPVVMLGNGHSFTWDFGLERWNLRYCDD